MNWHPFVSCCNNVKTQLSFLFQNFQFDITTDDSVPVDSKHYNFVFNVSNVIQSRRTESTFLEIDLFDMSVTKTNMIFRGSVVVPLAEIPEVEDKEDLKTTKCRQTQHFTRLPTLAEEWTLAKASFEVLAKRKDETSKTFVEFDEKCRKEKRIAVMPHHDDWAPGSGFILTSPVPKCFFPR